MNLFHDDDHDQLIAPPELFDADVLRAEHEDWGHQLLRAATALEFLAQITERGFEVLLKGGTLLQNSISWPPPRASIDLDLETDRADELEDTLSDIADAFSTTGLTIDLEDTPLPGFIAYVRFPRVQKPAWALRIDALENDHQPTGWAPWDQLPEPWSDAEPPLAAPVEARAAQKLLMAAEPVYGRDVTNHLGRQNFVKDLFDLHCLGELRLEGKALIDAAGEEVGRKSRYLGQAYELDTILEQASVCFRRFADPPVNDDSLQGSLWRAYNRVKGSIRVPFTQASLRTSAGCAHHCIEGIRRGEIEWEDAWRPAVEKAPRAAWEGREIRPIVAVEDDYGPVPGPLEAWAAYEP